jgi:integrative and conjugative element protein (TIGR02256 family)
MKTQYFSLENVVELENSSQLKSSRAQAIYAAISRNNDFHIHQLFKSIHGELPTIEYIVLDVECHSIPPNNVFGINFRERLAICIPENSTKIVEVLALRKDFPFLMHLNSFRVNTPANLCLYFEPPIAVLRTWTAENFLRRVQWWLEKSAVGELHPADQPVEQLFFNSPYELILPWNFDTLIEDHNQRFLIVNGPQRADQSITFFILPASQAESNKLSIKPIELRLPPIVHSHIEHNPSTLGELADVLKQRNIDLNSVLQCQIEQLVDEKGVPVNLDGTLTVILLFIPICRSENTSPEKVSIRAFLMQTGSLNLGKELGTLFVHNQLFYKDGLGKLSVSQNTSWRKNLLFPLEILRTLDSAAARAQSGLTETGEQNILIGAGSLGSAMLNLWGRSGWGQWTVVDKDHLKPHNLARHITFGTQLGLNKSDAVADLHSALTMGASSIVPICDDVTIPSSTTKEALSTSKLVVDASTTLEYPRFASLQDSFARHISVFVTPDGNAAVLLAEDKAREIRLRTIEAQYYRAVINSPWGEKHLKANLGTFWSGASCRDISTVLPYSRITAHAATLAEQVHQISTHPEAAIRIWERDPKLGNVNFYQQAVYQERKLDFGNLEISIDYGLEETLRNLRKSALPYETGGVLIGYIDFNINSIMIVDVLVAPPDSLSTSNSFERGTVGLVERIADAAKRTAGIVQYVGEWHSHPKNCSAAPSENDISQLAYLSLNMADDGLPAVSLIVGEHDIRIMKGNVA